MTTAFPQLEKALREGVEGNLGLILTNRSEQFSKEVIEPEVTAWIERTVAPIQSEAARDLADVVFEFDELLEDQFNVSRLENMILPGGLALAGGVIIIAGFLAGVSTATFLGIAIGTAVNWPILIGGAALGVLLLATGAVQLSHLKNKVADAFTKIFLPKLRDCLIGNGFEAKGEHHDALCRQFQDAIERTADEILANRKSLKRP